MLERPGVGVLKESSCDNVGGVHDHVGARDMLGVAVVVDDGHLVVAEVLACSGDGELSEVIQAHVVLGVW